MSSPSVCCSICASLDRGAGWGEFTTETGWETLEAPPQFRRLTRMTSKVYRCPQCGNYFDLAEHSETWLNTDYTSYSLRPRPSEPEGSTWRVTYDSLAASDLARVDRELLCHDRAAVRLEALRDLRDPIEEGLDLGPLLGRLRSLLSYGRPLTEESRRGLLKLRPRDGGDASKRAFDAAGEGFAIRRWSAWALAWHLARTGAWDEVEALSPVVARPLKLRLKV